MKIYFSIILSLILSTQLWAAEMTKFQVKRDGKRFYMDSTLIVDAPLESMYAIMLDYTNMHQFSRGMVHSQEVTPDVNGTPRVYTHLRGCVAFICRNIKRIERLETQNNNHIVASLEPDLSENVAWNISTWDFSELKKSGAGKTQIRYQLEFEPDFWVPPIIGPYLVKKSLAEDGLEIITRMEAHAQGNFPLDEKKNKRMSFPELEVEQKNIADMQKTNKEHDSVVIKH